MSALKEYRILRSKDTNPATDAALQVVLDANAAKYADAGAGYSVRDMPSVQLFQQDPGGNFDRTTIGTTVWMHPSDASRLIVIGAIEAV